MAVDLTALIAKLNDETRAALEAAGGLCLARTHYKVEIEHVLLKLLDQPTGDAAPILRHYGVDRARLSADLQRALDGVRAGNAGTPTFSAWVERMLTQAWTLGSVNHAATRVRTGHLLLALITDDELAHRTRTASRELQKISPEALTRDFATLVAGSAEQEGASTGRAAEASGGADGPAPAAGRTPGLDQFTVDLTERARRGQIDPVLGRDAEVRQVVDILMRRRQNNPILVGEAGVGKTAVVEGFAWRITQKDVPPPLQGVTVRTLDLALLQAGAGVKGEFEARLKGLIEEVTRSPKPIILFIDEAHTMIGAGGAPGQNDAANLLKPALARGELRTIAATTWSEYKRYFEKDPALTRRFQVVKVDEPDEERCLLMMRSVVPALERHHTVRVLDDGMDAAVRLSHRYLPDRQLPDKAVSVLDTACARLALGQSATPPAVEDAERVLADLEVQERVLRREETAGADHAERLARIIEERAATEARLADLRTRWERELALVRAIREARDALERTRAETAAAASTPNDMPAPADAAASDPAAMHAAMRAELTRLTAELEAAQGESPLVRVCVDASLVGEVISGWTGIPVGKMLRDEMGTVLELERHLGARVVGQAHALEVISRRIRTSRAGIEDPRKPKGVFLLVGPSGVGKTETALALADLLYGGERNLITINMSEFQEAHTVSTLKGSPPGYVGYGEGGVLTEAVRRRPYSVVLLDEVEKAHPDVLELFFQVFDKGTLEDGEGRQIDFRNTVIILTTNAGTDSIMRLTADPETAPTADALVRALKPELDKVFKPAFLGRLVTAPYFPVRDEVLRRIVRMKLDRVQRRLHEAHRVALLYDDALVDQIAARCTEVESGARNVDNILTNTVLPEVSRLLLAQIAEGGRPGAIRVAVDARGDLAYESLPVAGGPPAGEGPGAGWPAPAVQDAPVAHA